MVKQTALWESPVFETLLLLLPSEKTLASQCILKPQFFFSPGKWGKLRPSSQDYWMG